MPFPSTQQRTLAHDCTMTCRQERVARLPLCFLIVFSVFCGTSFRLPLNLGRKGKMPRDDQVHSHCGRCLSLPTGQFIPFNAYVRRTEQHQPPQKFRRALKALELAVIARRLSHINHEYYLIPPHNWRPPGQLNNRCCPQVHP